MLGPLYQTSIKVLIKEIMYVDTEVDWNLMCVRRAITFNRCIGNNYLKTNASARVWLSTSRISAVRQETTKYEYAKLKSMLEVDN